MRRYKDRWIIGVAAMLSALLHIALVLAFMRFSFSSVPIEPKAMDIDLADAASLQQLADQMSQQEPQRIDFRQTPGNDQVPVAPQAYSYRNNNVANTHDARRAVDEIQRRTGRPGPAQGAGSAAGPPSNQQTGSRSGQGSLPPIPEVGEGVGERRDDQRNPNQTGRGQASSVDQMIARAGMPNPTSGGGGNGVDQYNPNVGDGGSAVSISTREFKYMSYFAHMKEKIEMAWVYPQEAQSTGQQGMTTLQFVVLHSGQVKEVKVIRTSGFPLLDKYAVKAVREAHFNPMPDQWPDPQLTITANFIYRLVGYRTIQ